MAATVVSNIKLLLTSILSNTVGAAAAQAIVERSPSFSWASGVAADQADQVYSDTITIAASSDTTLDLTALTDAFGDALAFARIKAIIAIALAANTNDVLMGAAAADQFLGPLGSATDTIAIRPGGILACVSPDATGWALGVTTDLMFANGGAGTGVTFDLVLIGASA